MVVSRFEDYVGQPDSFDLATCAQAWHWIDPDRGPDVAASVLVPSGVLAIWWNRPAHFDGPTWNAIHEVYQKLAPELDRQTHLKERNYNAPLPPAASRFEEWSPTAYEWEQIYSPEEYAGFLGTHSDHILLPCDKRKALLNGVVDAINRHGGSLVYPWRTLLFTARKRT
jgi:hypothetical protein